MYNRKKYQVPSPQPKEFSSKMTLNDNEFQTAYNFYHIEDKDITDVYSEIKQINEHVQTLNELIESNKIYKEKFKTFLEGRQQKLDTDSDSFPDLIKDLSEEQQLYLLVLNYHPYDYKKTLGNDEYTTSKYTDTKLSIKKLGEFIIDLFKAQDFVNTFSEEKFNALKKPLDSDQFPATKEYSKLLENFNADLENLQKNETNLEVMADQLNNLERQITELEKSLKNNQQIIQKKQEIKAFNEGLKFISSPEDIASTLIKEALKFEENSLKQFLTSVKTWKEESTGEDSLHIKNVFDITRNSK